MYNMCEVFMCMCKVGVRRKGGTIYCLAARQGMGGGGDLFRTFPENTPNDRRQNVTALIQSTRAECRKRGGGGWRGGGKGFSILAFLQKETGSRRKQREKLLQHQNIIHAILTCG